MKAELFHALTDGVYGGDFQTILVGDDLEMGRGPVFVIVWRSLYQERSFLGVRSEGSVEQAGHMFGRGESNGKRSFGGRKRRFSMQEGQLISTPL